MRIPPGSPPYAGSPSTWRTPMSREVLLTGFGVRTAFGSGAEALRDGVFDGRPVFAPITRFDTGPYRTGMAATRGTSAPLHEVLAETAIAAVRMAGLPTG